MKFKLMKKKPMNKKGAITDLFIFLIFALIIIFICVIFVYIGNLTNTKLHEFFDGKMYGTANGTELVNQSMGKVNEAYQSLYWISWFLIIGMVIAIFVGSFMVTTNPFYFIIYIFVVVIAIIVSVAIQEAYLQVLEDPTLASTFAGFIASNFIMSKIAIWTAVIGIVGGVIMYSRMGSGREQYGGYGG